MQRQSTQDNVVLTSLVWPHERSTTPPRAFCQRLHLLAPQLPPSPPLVRILCRVGGDVVGEPVMPAAVDAAAVEPAGPADGAAEDDAAAVEPAGPLLADDAASVEPAGPALADNSGRSVPVMPAAAVDVPRLRILCRFFGGLARGWVVEPTLGTGEKPADSWGRRLRINRCLTCRNGGALAHLAPPLSETSRVGPGPGSNHVELPGAIQDPADVG